MGAALVRGSLVGSGLAGESSTGSWLGNGTVAEGIGEGEWVDEGEGESEGKG